MSVFVSDPGDELEYLEHDLAAARRELADSERADSTGRVTDREGWRRTVRADRERVEALEARLAEARAAEEAEAELAESYRDEADA